MVAPVALAVGLLPPPGRPPAGPAVRPLPPADAAGVDEADPSAPGAGCIQLEGGLSPSQVGLGLPASTRGAGSGYVSPTVVNNALDCLAGGTGCGSFKPAKTYPGLRGAMTWSTNWDALAGNAWSNAVGPKVHGLP